MPAAPQSEWPINSVRKPGLPNGRVSARAGSQGEGLQGSRGDCPHEEGETFIHAVVDPRMVVGELLVAMGNPQRL